MTMRVEGKAGASGRRRVGAALMIACLVGLMSLLTALAASAQMNPMMKEQLDRIPSGEEGVAQILGPMTERLELTDAQVKEVRPIIVELVSDMQAAKTKLETGETTVMKFMMEMNMQGEAAASAVEQHLTEPQLVEYASMREEQKLRMAQERRKAMQQMMKARQEAAAAAAAAEAQ